MNPLTSGVITCYNLFGGGGTPKSSMFIGFSIINHINHPFWGYPHLWKTPFTKWDEAPSGYHPDSHLVVSQL